MISGLSCLALNPVRFFFPESLFPSFQLNRTMLETHCKEKKKKKKKRKERKKRNPIAQGDIYCQVNRKDLIIVITGSP